MLFPEFIFNTLQKSFCFLWKHSTTKFLFTEFIFKYTNSSFILNLYSTLYKKVFVSWINTLKKVLLLNLSSTIQTNSGVFGKKKKHNIRATYFILRWHLFYFSVWNFWNNFQKQFWNFLNPSERLAPLSITGGPIKVSLLITATYGTESFKGSPPIGPSWTVMKKIPPWCTA